MMRFELVSATGTKYSGEPFEVLVPTKGGPIAIYEDHMPLIAAGTHGVLSVRVRANDPDSKLEHFAVYGGVIQTDGKNVRFITDDATTTDEVNEAEAHKALERARALVSGAQTREALHEARRVQVHHEVRLHLAQLKSRHHR